MPSNGPWHAPQVSEREATGTATSTPSTHAKAATPPTVYYPLRQQGPPSPSSEAKTPPHLPYSSIPVMNGSGNAVAAPSFHEVTQLSNSNSGINGSSFGNTNHLSGSGFTSNTNSSAMGYITIGNPPHLGDRQQSVLSRLRPAPNPRGVVSEPMPLPPSPPLGNAMPVQDSSMNPPMMVMMTNAEGHMALFPVVYNQPVYVVDQDGVMHQAQGPPQQQQIVYSVPLQGGMRPQPQQQQPQQQQEQPQ